ncbi:MAG: DUF4232 domain-containing protein [Acidimicrobiales bacterium]
MKKKLTPCAISLTLLLGAISAISFSSTPGGAAAVASCTPAHMRASLGTSEGAAGTIYVALVFTNTGQACAVWGVPSVQPVLKSRRHVGPAARNQSIGEMPARHVVTNGHSVSVAYGLTQTANYPASACVARAVNGVVVSLGTFVKPTYLRLPISVCTKRASTSTRLIVAGTTGS